MKGRDQSRGRKETGSPGFSGRESFDGVVSCELTSGKKETSRTLSSYLRTWASSSRVWRPSRQMRTMGVGSWQAADAKKGKEVEGLEAWGREVCLSATKPGYGIAQGALCSLLDLFFE